MDTLFSLKVFCQVVEQGSFTKASDKLGISTAMTSKHVSHLENQVKARLLHRNSRSLSLTAEGDIYYSQCLQALDILNDAEESISNDKQTPQGHLRIAVPIWCANPTFARWIFEYQALYPEVSVDLLLDNAMSDLVGEGFDLALRVNETLAPSLIVRPLMTVPFVLVATPEYLKQQGMPAKPTDLEKYDFVLPSYIDISQFDFDGEVLSLQTRTQSNNTVMLCEMIKSGSGIGFLPLWLVQAEIKSGRLLQLFADGNDTFEKTFPLYAVYLSRRHLSAKIRSFIDFLVDKSQSNIK